MGHSQDRDEWVTATTTILEELRDYRCCNGGNAKGVARHLCVCMLGNAKGVARHLPVCMLRNVKGVARHLRVCMQVTCADAYGARPTTLQLTRSMSTDINTPDCYTISVN
jgi:hypothetical protein